MSVYLSTVFIVLVCTYAAENQRRLNGTKNTQYRMFVGFACIVLICVAGFRYRVGTDYGSYMRGYEARVERVWSDVINFNEPGLSVLAYLGSLIYDDYAMMFFLASFITVYLNVKTIDKYSTNIVLGLLLYIFIGAWHGSFNGIRQYLAAAVLFAGHRFILEKRFWKYLCVVILAMCFHMTALIMLPVYFLANRRITIKNVVILCLFAIAMSLSYDLMFDIMENIKGRDQREYEYMQTSVNILRILVSFAPILMLTLVNRNYLVDRENTLYMNLLLVNAAFMFATSNSAYLARVGIYTDIYATLAFPRLLKGMSSSNRRVMTFLIVVLYFGYWLYEITSRGSQFTWIFSR